MVSLKRFFQKYHQQWFFKPVIFCSFICFSINLWPQITPKEVKLSPTQPWPAKWVHHPTDTGKEFGVYLFHKNFELESVPERFIIHISADNRYRLLVNGHIMGHGPARGDEYNWRYESYDIGGNLQAGENVISAIVWNFAENRPIAQHSIRTGLIIQGDSVTEEIINTDSSWKVFKDEAYSPIPVSYQDVLGYFAAGCGEQFDARKHPWGWEHKDFDDSAWEQAQEWESGMPKRATGRFGEVRSHLLVPRTIPAMEETEQSFESIRRSTPNNNYTAILNETGDMIIPAGQQISLLLDQGHLTTGYPVLKISGGKDAKIKITYAESLRDSEKRKGLRSQVTGKEIYGYHDLIISDDGRERTVQSLWWRTFRYVQLDITTSDEPLTIHQFHSVFTAYPFEEKAYFSSDYPRSYEIWEVAWRTQRLCAAETFFDCPYYEQLQYVGDTRIQALNSYYASGDARLFRKSITDFNDSRLAFGLTQSRYPSYFTQVIPPYSLFWIAMVHDYWSLVDDPGLVQKMLPGIADVLRWYEDRIDSNGMLGQMEWWNFADWVDHQGWESGIPPGAEEENSAVISFQLVYNLNLAAELFKAFGFPDVSMKYNQMAEDMMKAIHTHCWDEQKQLYADTPKKATFSQHANVMAVLVDAVPQQKQVELMNRIIDDPDLAQCSYYYRFYTVRALEKAGMTERYFDMLKAWEEMLDLGLTTFAERQEPTRSDCHAWSASPLYEFLATIAGIKPSEAHFKGVEIAPVFGTLTTISASVPHYKGEIEIALERTDDQILFGMVTIPDNLKAFLRWGSHRIQLQGGENEIYLSLK